MNLTLRQAVPADVPALRLLIDASVRGLQAGDYTRGQIEGALETVYGVDSQLIADGTYFVVEAEKMIVGRGGWSKHKTLFGGERLDGSRGLVVGSCHDAAKIRAFFVHPALGAARNWQHDPRNMRKSGDCSGLHSPGNGSDSDWSAALPRQRLRGAGKSGCSAAKWRNQ